MKIMMPEKSLRYLDRRQLKLHLPITSRLIRMNDLYEKFGMTPEEFAERHLKDYKTKRGR